MERTFFCVVSGGAVRSCLGKAPLRSMPRCTCETAAATVLDVAMSAQYFSEGGLATPRLARRKFVASSKRPCALRLNAPKHRRVCYTYQHFETYIITCIDYNTHSKVCRGIFASRDKVFFGFRSSSWARGTNRGLWGGRADARLVREPHSCPSPHAATRSS